MDVTWQSALLTRTQRWEALGQRGATVWFTGLPGSGKTTVAQAVEAALVLGGRSAYRLDGETITFTHTETPYRLQGQGIASRLVRGALEAARAEGLKVVPRCSFVSSYIARHPEFSDILA